MNEQELINKNPEELRKILISLNESINNKTILINQIMNHSNYSEYFKNSSNDINLELEDEYGDLYNREIAVKNMNATKDVLDDLSKLDKEFSVMYLILEHPKCTTENINNIFNNIANNNGKYDEIKYMIALHPKTNLELLDVLSMDNDVITKDCIAKNSNSTKEVLDNLLLDKEMFVIQSVLKNKNITKEQIETIYETHMDYDDINYSISLNNKTPINILEKFCFSDYHKNDNHLKFNVLDNQNVSKEIVERLCVDHNLEIQELAKNKSLEYIYDDTDAFDYLDEYSKVESKSTNYHKH